MIFIIRLVMIEYQSYYFIIPGVKNGQNDHLIPETI